MQIHSLQSTSAVQVASRVSQPNVAGNASGGAKAAVSAVDELELSSEAQQISQGQGIGQSEALTGGLRSEKVASLRAAIAGGAYETPEKMSAALDKLLDTFA